jgi:cyclase
VSNLRLIARLDIKGKNLIKSINLEGLRVIGSPADYALKYYQQGIDELIYMDCVASLYGRNHLEELISETAKDIFVPITVGGGIRSIDDVKKMLRAGADKIAINTAAVANPPLISDIARYFGSQCVVISIEAKLVDSGKWEVYTNNGRERSGLDVVDWAKKAASMGAGEILLTSVDREGTRKGFEIDLVHAVTNAVSVPVIASGGMGKPEDLINVVRLGRADAVAMADILHYDRCTVGDIRSFAKTSGFAVRTYGSC